MKLKPGVKLKDLSPQMALAALVVFSLYDKRGAECVITSANDSKHGTNSLHFRGGALDFRTKNYVGDKKWLRDEIADCLGEEFDVVLEDLGEDNEHLHVEYDPD